MKHRWLADFIAAIPDLTGHRFIDTDGEFSYKIHEPREVAERVVDALISEFGLREETRTNMMSSAGMTIDTKTGETTHHSDMRYDRRYVTDWKPT
jgi:hypothetical protein